MEGLSKKEKGLMDMDNSVVILGGEGSIRELNGNGRKYNKDEIQMQIYIFLNILP